MSDQLLLHANATLEEIMMECIKIINPIHESCQDQNELEELIFERMVWDRLNTVIDLLRNDLGHIEDETREGILEDYELALKLFKTQL